MARTTIMGWWAPRVWMASLVILMLCLSAYVFSQTVLFRELADWMASTGGVDSSLVAVLLLLPIVLVFTLITIVLAKGAKAALAASWTMVAPAILSLSGIDWLTVLTPSGSGGHFEVLLPSYVVVVITIGIGATCLCQRSYAQIASIRTGLLSRGIDRNEVDAATAKMFVSMTFLATGATLASLGVLAGGSALSSLSKIGGDGLVVGVIALCAALGAIVFVLRFIRARTAART